MRKKNLSEVNKSQFNLLCKTTQSQIQDGKHSKLSGTISKKKKVLRLIFTVFDKKIQIEYFFKVEENRLVKNRFSTM